jgi:hypothetical protein
MAKNVKRKRAMATVEYRYERIEGVGDEVVTALNRLGRAGWQVFQLEATAEDYHAWLSREVPIMASGPGTSDARDATRAAPAISPTRR